jgi:Concanavalin A-like lectin/glucanases superfamily
MKKTIHSRLNHLRRWLTARPIRMRVAWGTLTTVLVGVLIVAIVTSSQTPSVSAAGIYSTSTKDADGNSYLANTNTVADTFAYDTAKDSSPDVQQQLGIDPNWKNGVTQRSYAYSFDGSATSMYSNNSKLETAAVTANQISIEGWVNQATVSATQTLWRKALSVSTDGFEVSLISGIPRCQLYAGTSITLNASSAITIGAWTHIACVYDGRQLRLFVNGTQVGISSANNQYVLGNNSLFVGYNGGSNYFNGQMDEVRISNIARYTSAFTPQRYFVEDSKTIDLWHFDEGTGAPTDAAGTNNLTVASVGSGGWVSGNQALMSGYGSSGIQVASTASAAGSGYELRPTNNENLTFNGSSSYLYTLGTSTGTAMQFADTTFTIDFWMKNGTSDANTRYIIAKQVGTGGWGLNISNGTTLTFKMNNSSSSSNSFASSSYPADSQWHHVAVIATTSTTVTTGNTVQMYVDGAPISVTATYSNGVFYSTNSDLVTIGTNAANNAATQHFNGGLDEIRVSSGTRFTSSFTPSRRSVIDGTTLALWHFDEGSGTTTADSSGNSYTATLYTGTGTVGSDTVSAGSMWGASGVPANNQTTATNWQFPGYQFRQKINVSPSSAVNSGYIAESTLNRGTIIDNHQSQPSGNDWRMAYQPNAKRSIAINATAKWGMVPDSALIDQETSAFSVSVWAMANSGTGNNGRILTKGFNNGGTNGTFIIQLAATDNSLSAYLNTSATVNGAFSTCNAGTNGFTPNIWHHIVYTYNGSTTKLYQDGVQKCSISQTGNVYTGGGYPLSFGSGVSNDNSTNQNPFPGSIGEIRMYKKGLTDADVQAMYNAGNGGYGMPGESGLMGGWHINEGSGQVLQDYSGNGSNGFLGLNTSADGNDPVWSTTDGPMNVSYEIPRIVPKGHALQMTSSSSNITLPNSSTYLDSLEATDYSMGIWVKPSANPASAACILCKSSGEGLYMETNGAFSYKHTITGPTVVQALGSSGNTLNQWYFVSAAMSKTNGVVNLYVNGAQANKTTFTSGTSTVSNGVTKWVAGGSAYLGMMENIALYNTYLSQADMVALYGKGSAPTAKRSSTVALYHTDEGTGTSITDYSGNSLTATAASITWGLNGGVLDSTNQTDFAIQAPIASSGNDSNYYIYYGKPDETGAPLSARSNALNFGGSNTASNNVVIAANATINSVANRTISAWIYPRSSGGNSVGRILVNSAFDLMMFNNGLQFAQSFSTGTGTNQWVTTNTASTFTYNAWNLVTVVYDASSSSNSPTIYVNGASVALTQNITGGTGSFVGGSNPIYIGNYSSLQRSFDGYIKDVRFYNNASRTGSTFTSTDVTNLYKNPSLVSNAGLVGWWKLDDSTVSASGVPGTVATDSSPTGANGTLSGFTYMPTTGTGTTNGGWIFARNPLGSVDTVTSSGSAEQGGVEFWQYRAYTGRESIATSWLPAIPTQQGGEYALGATGVKVTISSNYAYSNNAVYEVASWAVEPSGANRGKQTAFPSKANIVVTGTSVLGDVAIIDASTNKLWMRFDAGSSLNGILTSLRIFGVTMLNGRLYLGSLGNNVVVIPFDQDWFYQYSNGTQFTGSATNISMRNSASAAKNSNATGTSLTASISNLTLAAGVVLNGSSLPKQYIVAAPAAGAGAAGLNVVTNDTSVAYAFTTTTLNPMYTLARGAGTITYQRPVIAPTSSTTGYSIYAVNITNGGVDRFDIGTALSASATSASFSYTTSSTPALRYSTVNTLSVSPGNSSVDYTSNLVAIGNYNTVTVINEVASMSGTTCSTCTVVRYVPSGVSGSSNWNSASFGGAAEFIGSGTSWLSASYNANYDVGSGSFTIEGWVNPTTTGVQRLMNFESMSLTFNQDSSLTNTPGMMRINLNGTNCYSSAAGTIPANQWTHLAYVVDRTNSVVRFYINGVQIGTAISFGAIGSMSAAVGYKFGVLTGNETNSPFLGYLDEVRVSNTARYSASSFTPSSTPFTTDANTLSLWHFDEPLGASFSDASGNGNSLTLTGGNMVQPTLAANTSSSPQVTSVAFSGGVDKGTGLTFNGTTQYAKVTSPTGLPAGSTNRTYSAWVYPTQALSSGTTETFLSYGTPDSAYFARTNTSGTQKLCFSGGSSSGVYLACYSGYTVTTNAWTHLTMTYNNTGSVNTVNFYANGSFVGSAQPSSVPIATSSGSLQIGNLVGNTNYFQGSIDDVRIYSAVLTPDQIAQLYNGGRGWNGNASDTGLVAAFNFNEGSGTSLKDYSATAATATYNPTTSTNQWRVGTPVRDNPALWVATNANGVSNTGGITAVSMSTNRAIVSYTSLSGMANFDPQTVNTFSGGLALVGFWDSASSTGGAWNPGLSGTVVDDPSLFGSALANAVVRAPSGTVRFRSGTGRVGQ